MKKVALLFCAYQAGATNCPVFGAPKKPRYEIIKKLQNSGQMSHNRRCYVNQLLKMPPLGSSENGGYRPARHTGRARFKRARNLGRVDLNLDMELNDK
ncbi:hypothetical protein L596_021581 [Steinernema carpocapsae]|uniref:Uncharacterized protein n=1 Tax=Steinernema carpocapsae TaxID=34508 RepID=A0A4U5MJ66_STECR|nr:hypothetical protein L596_021581 [Steinernema carpocapsae]